MFPKSNWALHQDASVPVSCPRLQKGGSGNLLPSSFRCCLGLTMGLSVCWAAWRASPGAIPSPPAHCSLVASMLWAVNRNVLVRLPLFSGGEEGSVDLVVPLCHILAAGDRRACRAPALDVLAASLLPCLFGFGLHDSLEAVIISQKQCQSYAVLSIRAAITPGGVSFVQEYSGTFKNKYLLRR